MTMGYLVRCYFVLRDFIVTIRSQQIHNHSSSTEQTLDKVRRAMDYWHLYRDMEILPVSYEALLMNPRYVDAILAFYGLKQKEP
jgi:hypothetical protein